jgi:outer membrane protein assembly factor BamC
MTTRKNSNLAKHGLVYVLTFSSLVGCSSLNTMLDGRRIDYKSDGEKKTPTLDVPPDLTQLQRENRYSIPGNNNGTATASGYNSQQASRQPTSAAVAVAPKSTLDMHIERSGNQRWLVVKQAPEVLWPQIKDFWQDSGFLINVDSPQTGVMETDWAENRAKIPQDIIRNTLGKIFDSLYSTGERDKFRTRLERVADGTTEIYISHRGAEEVVTGQDKDGTIWTARQADPELEAEFLSRLMARLGSEEVQAKTAVVSAVVQPARAKVVKGNNGGYVEVDESFDRAWRRVGLALDRVGFTVEDRDRTQGLYFVRYVNQDKDAQSKAAAEKGFLSRLFSGSGDKTISAQRYQVAVKATGAVSQIAVLNNEGQPETSAAASKILSLLNDQLK